MRPIKWSFLAVLYLFILILTYVSVTLYNHLNNNLLFSIILSLFVILILVSYSWFNIANKPGLKGELVRYKMFCKKCGWEWMSNASKKAPKFCPSCRSNDLEILGWNKVSLPVKRSNKDLRSFFRRPL